MVDAPLPIHVQNLVVEYGKGAKKVQAVNGISFEVQPGECVGFIGPNGAGKSTTIKALMGFLFPSSGTVEVFGQPAGTVESRRRMGYLPEVALYYPYMKAGELLELYGGLQGMGRRDLREKIPALLKEIGLGGAENRLLKTFSKGMQQRLGIAQAIIADPDLLVFDELSSGLDPVGRYDLRQVLLRIRERGRTIFFSSHELTEVEDLCDRVIVVYQGQVLEQAPVRQLLQPLDSYCVRFSLPATASKPDLAQFNVEAQEHDGVYECEVTGAELYARLLKHLTDNGASIEEAESSHVSLEQHFMNLIRGERGEEVTS